MLIYRFVTAIIAIYATQRISHFFYQLFDLLIIENLDINYTFDKHGIDKVQTWIVYTSCCFQSFPIMLISVGIMTLTQGFSEHPFLLFSFVISFLFSTYSIIINDRIVYTEYAQKLQLDLSEYRNIEKAANWKEALSGYCCLCGAFRIEYVYRVLFRCFDFQFRIFLLNFIWTGIGGAYLAMYLFAEFIFLFRKARKIGRYQIISGLLGIVINFTSPQAKKFSIFFAKYRFFTNYVLLILIALCVNISETDYIPISDAYERRRSDLMLQSNMFWLFLYCIALSFINPWLYFCAIQNGECLLTETTSTNPMDPHFIIANKAFPVFLQLIVFGNKFHHGNEWVLEGLLDAIKDNIFRIPPKYLCLLLKSYNWDFNKISFYTKSKFFSSVMRFHDLSLIRLLFDVMSECNDIKGVETGLLYWSQTRNFEADNEVFLKMIICIEQKFGMNKLNVLVQSALLKFCILRGGKLGDLTPFHAMLNYNLNAMTLSHLYLHYTDFDEVSDKEWNKQMFAEILHCLHHVKNFEFNVDNHTAKFFLFWALKFELWQTLNELIKNSHHSKQIYSKFDNEMQSFLHLICLTPCDYVEESEKSEHLCEIAFKCLNNVYTPLNERNKQKMTNLMCACQNLHVPLIRILLKFGPDVDAKDDKQNDCKWYIENNVYSKNANDEEMENQKSSALTLIECAQNEQRTQNEEEFIEDYEERYQNFVLNDESIPLYRSTRNDFNALFEAILKNDFQRIIDLIDRYHIDPNAPTIDGTTPLHFACEHSGALIVKFLMDRGAFPFKIRSDHLFPIDMMRMNQSLDEDERKFMQRLLDVRDVDHNPFALTDERVIELERMRLFLNIFVKYLLILFCVFFVTFATSVGLQDKFDFGYIPPLPEVNI